MTSSGRKRNDGGLMRLVAFGFAIAAIIQELRLPKQDRTWHGRVLFVPYELRPPTPERLFRAWWDPEDPRIIGSKGFGVGWAVNLPGLAAAVRHRLAR